MGEGLSVHYSGGNSLPDDVAEWLEENGIGESQSAQVEERRSI